MEMNRETTTYILRLYVCFLNSGHFLGGSHNTDSNILGLYWGPLLSGNYQCRNYTELHEGPLR